MIGPTNRAWTTLIAQDPRRDVGRQPRLSAAAASGGCSNSPRDRADPVFNVDVYDALHDKRRQRPLRQSRSRTSSGSSSSACRATRSSGRYPTIPHRAGNPRRRQRRATSAFLDRSFSSDERRHVPSGHRRRRAATRARGAAAASGIRVTRLAASDLAALAQPSRGRRESSCSTCASRRAAARRCRAQAAASRRPRVVLVVRRSSRR